MYEIKEFFMKIEEEEEEEEKHLMTRVSSRRNEKDMFC